MQRWTLRLGLLLTPLTLFVNADIVRADYGDRLYWQSRTGQTSFSDPIAIACNAQGRAPIAYTTIYEGVEYSGTLWVTSVSDCNRNVRQLRISGDFEDGNAAGTERCVGQLTLSFNLPNGPIFSDSLIGDGTAQWRNIHAVQEYSCSAEGVDLPPLAIYPTYANSSSVNNFFVPGTNNSTASSCPSSIPSVDPWRLENPVILGNNVLSARYYDRVILAGDTEYVQAFLNCYDLTVKYRADYNSSRPVWGACALIEQNNQSQTVCVAVDSTGREADSRIFDPDYNNSVATAIFNR